MPRVSQCKGTSESSRNRTTDRDGRIGNDAAFSMNAADHQRHRIGKIAIGAAIRGKSANSFLGLSQCLNAFVQANALVIRQGRVEDLETALPTDDAGQRERYSEL